MLGVGIARANTGVFLNLRGGKKAAVVYTVIVDGAGDPIVDGSGSPIVSGPGIIAVFLLGLSQLIHKINWSILGESI